MKGVLADGLGRSVRAGFAHHPPHPLNSDGIVKAIAGMSGRSIISAPSSGSPFTPTIGDGLSTSTRVPLA